MFEDPKPFASLGATLLARKGGAKPAMRPQLSPLLSGSHEPSTSGDLDDLGWNDMGSDEAPSLTNLTRMTAEPYEPELSDFDDEDEDEFEDDSSYASLLTPASADDAALDLAEAATQAIEIAEVAQPEEPEIRHQQQRLSAALDPKPAAPRRKARDEGRRAAFTLRLDAQRHLKLRLASTVRNRSAQQLVTEALDQFLAGIPEIDALAAQVKRA